jgi:DNA polymerase III alpha subunit
VQRETNFYETGGERIIDYIRDARKHDISVSRLDLNKSKQDFEINGNTIYYGFSKVLGVGAAVAIAFMTVLLAVFMPFDFDGRC